MAYRNYSNPKIGFWQVHGTAIFPPDFTIFQLSISLGLAKNQLPLGMAPGPTHLEPVTTSEGEVATWRKYQGRKPFSAALSAGHGGFVLGKIMEL